MKAADGNLFTKERAKLERWREHVKTIQNKPDPPVPADLPEAEEDLDTNTGNITVKVVREAINILKNEKAPGLDGVCPEMLKVGDATDPSEHPKGHLEERDSPRGLEEWHHQASQEGGSLGL